MKQTGIKDFHIKQQESKGRGVYGWGQRGERRYTTVKRESKAQPRSIQLIKEGIRQANYSYWNTCIPWRLPDHQPSGCTGKYIYMLISLFILFLWSFADTFKNHNLEKKNNIQSVPMDITWHPVQKIPLKNRQKRALTTIGFFP